MSKSGAEGLGYLGDDGEDLASGKEFLSFILGAEEYGIDILKVQEIRG